MNRSKYFYMINKHANLMCWCLACLLPRGFHESGWQWVSECRWKIVLRSPFLRKPFPPFNNPSTRNQRLTHHMSPERKYYVPASSSLWSRQDKKILRNLHTMLAYAPAKLWILLVQAEAQSSNFGIQIAETYCFAS